MANDNDEEKKPEPKKVAEARLPDPDPPFVRETMQAEIDDLRRQLAERDETILELQTELGLLPELEEKEEPDGTPKRREKKSATFNIADWLP